MRISGCVFAVVWKLFNSKKMKTEIEKFNPCLDALKFRRKFSTFKEAWDACPCGDWMLWIAVRLNVDKRKLTLAKGRCAETIVHLMKDQRSRDAVKAAIDYGNGLIDETELQTAAYAALAAYAAAYASYATASAADAADAASSAADAADAAAYAAASAAASAADAATSAADAADAADAASAAYEKNRLQTADICREILTDEVMEKIDKL
jgi:hypothetical protein